MATVSYNPPLPAAGRDEASLRPIAHWLLFCCAMVFAMAVIGAVTRLTESGLLMVEWKPLIGVLPPLSNAEWERVFDLYRQTPEYRYVNAGMTLDEFRYIFYWEWFHRLWGHLIGLAFLVPFVWFWLSGRIPRALLAKLIGLFLLGGLQGVIGWLMVASGLVDRPSVSHYRLAAHLSMAVLIYGLLLWVALGLLAGESGTRRPHAHWPDAVRGLRRHAGAALALVGVTMVWGAFVAGLDAGRIYPEWPLMGDRLVPAEAWDMRPWWINPLENHAAVQFVHRWLAVAAALGVLTLVWRTLRRGAAGPGSDRVRLAGLLLGAGVVGQVGLGIATLHTGVAIPVAAAHQAGALVVVALLVWYLSELTRPG
ncbi:MAG TPA: COX15/CtaA family protein [Arenibaculum sp.]|nr:COX15/CtaA family protein [Arenibaculum sp.]